MQSENKSESKKTKSKTNQSNQTNKPMLRILMLHGYRQNEQAFRERSGGLRKALKNHVQEFVFCESPHLVLNSSATSETSEKGWWFSSETSYNALEVTDCQKGFDESLDYIDKIFETKGPFDGILGFSQGACLAAMLCKISNENPGEKKYKFISFKFAIIIAGFKSNQCQHSVFYDLNKKINMPTCHIIGKEDKVIPCEMASKLVEYFESPKVYFHEGGHLIPVNSDSKNFLFDFFNSIAYIV